jgi:drug/metabolite transporter (DMT)-like permease
MIPDGRPAAPRRGLAILAMIAAMLIYGANFGISRHGLLNGLTTHDLTFLRFAFSGLLLLPLFLKAGVKDCAGVGWGRGLIITISSGLPMTMLMLQGLAWSPAAHGSAIGPGTVVVVGAIGGLILFGVRPNRLTIIGIGVVLAGLVCIALAGSTADARNVLLGDLCFIGVGLIWGVYPLLLQLWRIDPLRATAILSVLSLAMFAPWYLWHHGAHFLTLPLGLVLIHGFNQGILNMIVGLWLWGFAVQEIGSAETGQYPPLIPVIGTLSAIPLLGEIPGPLQWTGVGIIVTGLMLTALARR